MERDWRIVAIPEEDAATASVLTLFEAIVQHTYDSLEPFSLSEDCPVQAQVGRTAHDKLTFQDVPMNARLIELVNDFGMYIKFILQFESPPAGSAATSSNILQPGRNAIEVSLSIC